MVKVITALNGDAIYFSRTPLPYYREADPAPAFYYKHIGLYVYRRDFLLHYPDLSVGPLETAERLEQLRALESGYRIRVVETDYESLGVDTPEDLDSVNELFSTTTGVAEQGWTGREGTVSEPTGVATEVSCRYAIDQQVGKSLI